MELTPQELTEIADHEALRASRITSPLCHHLVCGHWNEEACREECDLDDAALKESPEV